MQIYTIYMRTFVIFLYKINNKMSFCDELYLSYVNNCFKTSGERRVPRVEWCRR